MGPTASGKTDLAIKLAEHFSVELISVDSALIYKTMDIGTAKPTATSLKKYPHHLIDICDPSEKYSAGAFCENIHRLVPTIFQQNKCPLLVGGTMMYFNALFKGLAHLPDAEPAIRENLNQLMQKYGTHYMHQKLQQIDAIAASQIHPNDPQRIQRALEVYEASGQPISHYWQQSSHEKPYQFLKIALNPYDRKILHQRIEKRFDIMLDQGFLDEVKTLMARDDLSLDLPAMRCVGYRQAWAYLSGEYDFDTMRSKAIAATRQLAKRQITWLKSFDDVHWFDSCDEALFDKACQLINKFT